MIKKQAVNVEYLEKYVSGVVEVLVSRIDDLENEKYVPPVGSQYVQYPSEKSNVFEVAFPKEKRPDSLWPDTTWEPLFEDEEVFFRTGGTLPEPASPTAEDKRTNGLQNDQFRSHSHALVPFRRRNNDYDTGSYRDSWTWHNGGAIYTYASGGTETRPKNRYVVVWERVG